MDGKLKLDVAALSVDSFDTALAVQATDFAATVTGCSGPACNTRNTCTTRLC